MHGRYTIQSDACNGCMRTGDNMICSNQMWMPGITERDPCTLLHCYTHAYLKMRRIEVMSFHVCVCSPTKSDPRAGSPIRYPDRPGVWLRLRIRHCEGHLLRGLCHCLMWTGTASLAAAGAATAGFTRSSRKRRSGGQTHELWEGCQ